jgi:hypothetical protein
MAFRVLLLLELFATVGLLPSHQKPTTALGPYFKQDHFLFF